MTDAEARVRELEAERDRAVESVGEINNAWHIETMRKLAAEARVRELEEHAEVMNSMRDFLRAETSAAESRLAAATALLERVTTWCDNDESWFGFVADVRAFLAGQPAAPTRTELARREAAK